MKLGLNEHKIKIKGHGRASTTLTKENVIWTLSEAKDPNRKNFWRNTLCQRQTIIVHVLVCTTHHQLLTQVLIYDVQKLHTNSSSSSWPRVSILYILTYLGYRGARRSWMNRFVTRLGRLYNLGLPLPPFRMGVKM